MIPFFVLLAFRKRNPSSLNLKNRAAEITRAPIFFAEASQSMAACALVDPIFLDTRGRFILVRP